MNHQCSLVRNNADSLRRLWLNTRNFDFPRIWMNFFLRTATSYNPKSCEKRQCAFHGGTSTNPRYCTLKRLPEYVPVLNLIFQYTVEGSVLRPALIPNKSNHHVTKRDRLSALLYCTIFTPHNQVWGRCHSLPEEHSNYQPAMHLPHSPFARPSMRANSGWPEIRFAPKQALFLTIPLMFFYTSPCVFLSNVLNGFAM